ncbi:MAG: DUF3795 domain-containing protein [Candidatus Methanomethylophilaceae archaeon]|nr:DUF3795 domain-containing protein [Candidatus Methanomethylophilaceae archaeon]
MNRFIAYCGLDCETCEAYIATKNDDDGLRREIARKWSEMNGVEITPDMINCEGCRMDGAKTPYCESLCQIRQCAMGKGLETCGGCQGMGSCEKMRMVVEAAPEALENLRSSRRPRRRGGGSLRPNSNVR